MCRLCGRSYIRDAQRRSASFVPTITFKSCGFRSRTEQNRLRILHAGSPGGAGAALVCASSGRPRRERPRQGSPRGGGAEEAAGIQPPRSLPDIVPPVVRHGHVGWPDDPAVADEDARFFEGLRAAELAFRAPHAQPEPASGGPPLDRHGRPVQYPAAAVLDHNIRGWRPTTEEEERHLREPGPWDPFYVPASASKSAAGRVARLQRPVKSETDPYNDWVSIAEYGRHRAIPERTVEGDTKQNNSGTEEDDDSPPHSSLLIRFLSQNAQLTVLNERNVVSGRPVGVAGQEEDNVSGTAKAGAGETDYMEAARLTYEPLRWRRPLDLPPGAWRVVNLGTSSAVPTRKRNVSCTAFISSPPVPPCSVPDVEGSPRSGRARASSSSRDAQDHRIQFSAVCEEPEPSMFLVDAGENASARLEAAYWCSTHGFRWIRAIFITHLHGDHIYGLPSLLQNIGRFAQFRRRRALENGDDGSDPVIRIFGPHGTRGFVRMSLFWTPPLGVRFSVAELVPRDSDFKHVKEVRSYRVGVRDTVYGVLPEEFPDLSRETPPPHPEEQRVDDVLADEDGLWHVWNDDDGSGIHVFAAPLKHRVPCFGYVFHELEQDQERLRRDCTGSSSEGVTGRSPSGLRSTCGGDVVVDMQKAKALGVHGRQYSVLRSGRSVTIKGTNAVVAPEDVAVGPLRSKDGGEAVLNSRANAGRVSSSDLEGPRKVVLLGDTCDSSAIAEAARDADLLMHEATFCNELSAKAFIAMHSTAAMAGKFAKEIRARKLVLSHFSSRYEVRQLSALITEAEDGAGGVSDFGGESADDEMVRDDQSEDNGEEQDNDLVEDEDMSSPSLLVREAAAEFGDEARIVAATDFMEHTIFRPHHGSVEWQQRILERERRRDCP